MKEKNNIFRNFLIQIIEEISPFSIYIGLFLNLLDFILILGYFITKNSSLFFLVILSIFTLFLMFFTKDLLEEKQQKKLFRICKMALILNIFMFINHLAKIFSNLFKRSLDASSLTMSTNMGIKNSNGIGVVLLLLIYFIVFFFVTFYLGSTLMEKYINAYYETNFLEKFHFV